MKIVKMKYTLVIFLCILSVTNSDRKERRRNRRIKVFLIIFIIWKFNLSKIFTKTLYRYESNFFNLINFYYHSYEMSVCMSFKMGKRDFPI